ncbi:hypothetical protein LUZ60_004907 [Juncus effusus]|nr:hypothetical protein LUZ60_004907 [Juncus effusus]
MDQLCGGSDMADGYWRDLFELGDLPAAYDLPELAGLAAPAETVQTSVLSGPLIGPSSSEELPAQSDGPPEKETEGKNVKAKKMKGEKRRREQRFAFMTKSETDHLEDGYRWRKYGQKSVKNSPFPRSYYKCTYDKCTVKKQVERSSNDRSVVVTTYEGRHCHHANPIPRQKAFFSKSTNLFDGSVAPLSYSAPPIQINFQAAHHTFHQMKQLKCFKEETGDYELGDLVDDALLRDMVLPPNMRNN